MSAWDEYPADYRAPEAARILAAARAGECASLVGLSGAGKSNLLGFLAHRVTWAGAFVLVDGNCLPHPTADAFLGLISQSLGYPAPAGGGYPALEGAVSLWLARRPAGLCLLLDRFDALDGAEAQAAARNLRALRDAHKYALTFVTATRRPLDARSELAELAFGNTLWLGALGESDTAWNVRQYAARKGLLWDQQTAMAMRKFSGGYPALLRAVCEAHAAGAPLRLDALRAHPAVLRRMEEFWADAPAADMLERSGLAGLPLLAGSRPPGAEPAPAGLTAKEALLYGYLRARAGQVCAKDELIRAVWREDRVFEEGVRDDSLAQLVRRLRRKVEPEPSSPQAIETVPGRGYVWRG
jgi:energy-coupling factor transporter ATP-binding protein EcfA2